jgi:hypothetical protein
LICQTTTSNAPDVLFRVSPQGVQSKNFRKKYNGFTMEDARPLQCKALRGQEKSLRRKNNGKQCEEQWKQSGIRARADASPRHIDATQSIARRREAPGAHVQD